ncbi:homoserine dehydrogenase [Enterococcus hirae]|nr:homoserine dehydrogenase [Enterococcus hirae]
MKKQLNVGMLGFGVVGSGVPQILAESAEKIRQIAGVEFVIKKALVRSADETSELMKRAGRYGIELTTKAEDVLEDSEIDIVIEVMGKIEPAKSFIKRAMNAGKHVITANKDLLAQHGPELIALAKKQQTAFYYEASVAGGIPILRTLVNSLAADRIESVMGIVNGTTNYMLTQMTQLGASYDTALAEAQRLGFAESDPTNDVSGLDALYKMVILSDFAYGMEVSVDEVARRGIEGLSTDVVKASEELGFIVKLIGITEDTGHGIHVEVAPMLVPADHPLASVANENNSVFVKSFGINGSMYYGPGAGTLPTATSIVSDLIAIAEDMKANRLGTLFNVYHMPKKIADDASITSRFFLAIGVPNNKGQLSALTGMLSGMGVEFDQLLQKNQGEQAVLNIITYPLDLKTLRNILNVLSDDEAYILLDCLRVIE